MSDDPYAALGVAKTASDEEIRKAYKKIAKTSHPDLNPGDAKAADRFKAAAAANDLLKDPEKRRRFDAGEIDASGQERPERRFYREYAEGPEATYHTSRGFDDFGDYSDVFADLFGSRARARARRGDADARAGCALHAERRLPRGGARRDAADHHARRRVLDVKIRRGWPTDRRSGCAARAVPGIGGGEAGDALVTVTVEPHDFFVREGDDILVELPIRLDEAVLGAKVEVPTVDGRVSLTIPKGASSGRMLRLRGKGVKRGGKQGDQLVTLKIVAPPVIDSELEEFFRGWRERHAYDPRKGVVP